MIKRIKENLITIESMISLIGFINTSFGVLGKQDMSILIRIVMLTTGLISVIYIIYSSTQKQKVSNFITNNEEKYNEQRKSPFIDFEDKKKWMFLCFSR